MSGNVSFFGAAARRLVVVSDRLGHSLSKAESIHCTLASTMRIVRSKLPFAVHGVPSARIVVVVVVVVAAVDLW